MAAPPPLIALRAGRVSFGGRPLFDGVALALARGEKACLVGRNGSGKSTLLKVLAGALELDGGERFLQPGARLAELPQEPRLEPEARALDYVAAGDPERRGHRAEAMLAAVGLAGERRLGTLSGGEARRAALARALVGEPDLLLLDEPTNHLDLATIEWLEETLACFRGGLLVVSHDRAFLKRVAGTTLWLDRGSLRRLDAGFERFDAWEEEVLAAEAREAERLDTKLAQELHWLARGVTARRRRNQGRLRALGTLRARRAELLGAQPGRVKLALETAAVSGRTVIEAEHIAKHYPLPGGGTRPVIRDFSTRILRGDRVGVIGPNGAGKTTLLRLLTGGLQPDRGTVRLGTNLELAYFDQRRAVLDPERTLWQTLCPGGGDSVIHQGRSRHVVGYLRDFLFDERQALAPVKSLSGGERNRLLLAKLFIQPSNLLVLDEPTNDLDMDTLDLMEEMLGDFEGTLLLVSHDRDFLDRLATSTIALEGDGEAAEYPGGYSDYLVQRAPRALARAAAEPGSRKAAPSANRPPSAQRKADRLSYNEQRELERLPAQIETLEAECQRLEVLLGDPSLYGRDRAAFEHATGRLPVARAELEAAELRWLELEERHGGG